MRIPRQVRVASVGHVATLGLSVLLAVVVAACGLGGDDEVAGPATISSVVDTDAPVDSTSTTAAPAATPTTATPTETTTADLDGAVSFASTIKPIVTETCASCHTGDGPGTPHLKYETADDVARTSFAMALVVESRYMPPWPAGGDSVEFEHDWSLTDDEIAAILEWDDAGSPLDVDPDEPIVPARGVVGIENPDIVIPAAGSYQGEMGQPDEYRCFVYDPEVTERSFARQMQFTPQQREVVHHAVGFLVSASDRAAIEAQDEADEGGGWSCFGFRPAATAELVFTWAPGSDPNTYPLGTGLELEPGDFFVMQTHFHFEVDAPADQSTFSIEWARPVDGRPVEAIELVTYVGPAEIPCASTESGPLCDRDAARQRAVDAYGPEGVLADLLLAVCGYTVDDFAGMTNGIASASCDLPVRQRGRILSIHGHQHELGASFRMILNPDTPDELVLLDIPTWDFDWQLIYEPVDDIVVGPGDVIRVECVWDRALRDPALEPAYVLWADGTDDEMCFSTLATGPD